jgi:hypothetical protein
MRKYNIALLSLVFTFFIAAALPVALPVFAEDTVDMHSFVDYRDGVLYVFHISTGDPVSVHIPPELKVTGQVVEATWQQNGGVAKFSPAVGGDYSFQDERGVLSYDLIIAYLAGEGNISVSVDGEERVIPVDSPGNKKFNMKLPDFEIQYTEPYELTATGNIRASKISTTEVTEINKDLPPGVKELSKKGGVKKDTWQYGAEGNILDGTMTLRYNVRYNERTYVGFTFPFCPGAAYGWLSKLPDPTVPGSPPGEPDGQNPPPGGGNSGKAGYFIVPALLLALAYLLRRPVCVSVEPVPDGVRVFRDYRGPVRVRVTVVDGANELVQREMEREESFILPVAGPGTVRVKVPVWCRNVSKRKETIYNA